MAWELRHGRSYFYRARRDGGRVIKQYVGAGDAGEQAAAEVAARCQQRELRRDQQRAIAALLLPFDEYWIFTDGLLRLAACGARITKGNQ